MIQVPELRGAEYDMWDTDGSFEVTCVVVLANETCAILVFSRWTWGMMRGVEGMLIL